MSFYDPDLVDEKVKTELVQLLANYDGGKVCWYLDTVASAIIKGRSEQELTYSSPTVDRLACWLSDGREMRLCFYTLLIDTAVFDPDRPRLPNGSIVADWVDLVKLALPVVQPLAFPQRINTWLAVSVEWLAICNTDWIKSNPSLEGISWTEPPSDKRLYARWIPKFIYACTFLYGG